MQGSLEFLTPLVRARSCYFVDRTNRYFMNDPQIHTKHTKDQ